MGELHSKNKSPGISRKKKGKNVNQQGEGLNIESATLATEMGGHLQRGGKRRRNSPFLSASQKHREPVGPRKLYPSY